MKDARLLALNKWIDTKLVLFSLLAISSGLAQALDGHRATAPHAHAAALVDQTHRGSERITLAAGRMIYSDDVDNEGYLPAHSIAVVADQQSRVFDYRAGFTAFQLGDRAEVALRAQGYHILFRCARSTCGDSDGWRLFLGDALAGSESSQYYLLASREIDARRREYAQYYVADLHGQPRLLLNTFVGQPLETGATDPTHPLPLYFSPGSSELTLPAREALRDWIDRVELTAGSAIEITGYADSQGPAALNQVLSQQRADVVARWLKAEAAMANVRITASAGGVDAKAGQQGGNAFADGRRVELRVMPAKAADNDKIALRRGN